MHFFAINPRRSYIFRYTIGSGVTSPQNYPSFSGSIQVINQGRGMEKGEGPVKIYISLYRGRIEDLKRDGAI